MRTWIGNPFVLLLFLPVPFLHGCEAQSNAIKGNIHLTSGWKLKVYLIKPQHFQEIAADYLGQVVDSAGIMPDGSFSFKSISDLKNKTLFFLVIQPIGSRYANHLIDEDPAHANYMPVFYSPGESLDCSADGNSFQSSFFLNSISKENLNLIALRDIRQHAFEKYHRLSGVFEEDSLLIEKEKAFSDYITAMMSFADTTKVVEAALLAIRWISPTNDYERIPEFIFNQCQKWSLSNPESTFVRDLCTIARKDKLPVMSGNMMPDINLPLLSGDTALLFSLLGKKLTLVDLWASWCAPCRKESREELLPLWKKYHEKGFQIIGYSIDANEGSWKNAIVKDGAHWIQASHLTGDSTPFMEALRISTIPANYLVDVNGMIVAKNLHGNALRNYIEDYLH